MNKRTKAWGDKYLKDGTRIVQSKVVQDGKGGYHTLVTLTGADGTEQGGWHKVDGTTAQTLEEARNVQSNAFYDTKIPKTQATQEQVVQPVLNPDNTIDKEATFLAKQQAQPANLQPRTEPSLGYDTEQRGKIKHRDDSEGVVTGKPDVD